MRPADYAVTFGIRQPAVITYCAHSTGALHLAATDIDAARDEAILSGSAGFPFLLVYSFAWLAAGGLSYHVSNAVAPWLYLLGGVPMTPIAFLLERRVAYARVTGPDPLLPLALQILFVQIVAFPAIMLVWSLSPNYVPVAFAAVVGAHFLPFHWVYGTPLYTIMGVLVSGGSYIIAGMFGEEAIHYTGFFVGTVLLVGAFFARSHAKATAQRVLRRNV